MEITVQPLINSIRLKIVHTIYSLFHALSLSLSLSLSLLTYFSITCLTIYQYIRYSNSLPHQSIGRIIIFAVFSEYPTPCHANQAITSSEC